MSKLPKTPDDVFDFLSRLQDRLDSGENVVQQMFDSYRNACLGGTEETRRRFIESKPNGTSYYRKMSPGEWNAATQSGKVKYNFKAPFSYNNTRNYRLWMSTALDKVRIFGNEDCTSDADVVVEFEFSCDLTKKFTIKAHQEKGVQNTPNVVAIHREGFADIMSGPKTVKPSMSSDEDVKIVLEGDKAFNLGFTSDQMSALNSYLVTATILNLRT